MLKKFYESAKDKNSDEKGKSFEKANTIKNVHQKHVQSGQSSVKDEVDTHFIALIPYGNIYYFVSG
jgi:hypothetical protein